MVGYTPVYRGGAWQQGYGLGSIFGSLFRSAIPLLKDTGKTFVKNLSRKALKTGVGVAGDVIRGRNLEDSVKKRMIQAMTNAVPDPIPYKKPRKKRTGSKLKKAQKKKPLHRIEETQSKFVTFRALQI